MDILILQKFLEVPCHRSKPKLNNLYKIHPCIWARTESQFIAFELRANPLNPGHVQHALPSSCNHAPTKASTPGRARGAGHEQVPNFRIWCTSELHRISDIGLHLVGAWPIPLKNDGVKVSWDDDIPNIYGKIIAMFQRTNQSHSTMKWPSSTYKPSLVPPPHCRYRTHWQANW